MFQNLTNSKIFSKTLQINFLFRTIQIQKDFLKVLKHFECFFAGIFFELLKTWQVLNILVEFS